MTLIAAIHVCINTPSRSTFRIKDTKSYLSPEVCSAPKNVFMKVIQIHIKVMIFSTFDRNHYEVEFK